LTQVPFDRWQHETKFGMTVTFEDKGGEIGAVLSYRGDRFTEPDVTRMADWLGRLLAEAGELVGTPLETVLPGVTARQYRDFALTQAQRQAATGEAEIAHWTDVLDGA